MLATIKTQFVNKIKELDYNVTDNGTYRENFPWLMVRTGGHQSSVSLDVRYDIITLILDIFSTYNGEKEIIEISENILSHLKELRENPHITSAIQSGMKILDDNSSGPVRKHGVVTYQFIVTSGIEEVYNEDSPTGN